ncbi:MAG: class IV adenylate cyclase [Planctomycetes bacterium]|nr:class IV adenylate cyclase [Planctomycetota bacterium]
MPEEIEAKVRIASPEDFRRRLAARGLAEAGTVFEVNRLFDDAAGSLRRRGSALRLREERRPDDGTPVRAVLTFKGPVAESRMKRRPEVEVVVGAAAPVAAILEALGLAEAFRYEKRRTTWHAGPCEVVLDEVPHLGWFAEVEGPSEEAVEAVLDDVGLGGEPIIRRGYVRLLSQHLESLGLDPTRAVFSP